MKILILSQFYKPEPCAASNRIDAMASQLARDGNEVTVLTGFPSFPSGTIEERYRGLRGLRERDGEVEVVRVWTYASTKLRAGNRVLNWLSVALGACAHVVDPRHGYDVIIMSTPPITLALPAVLGKFAQRARLVADVRDVFPEVAIEMGAWKRGSAVARAVGLVADILYRAATTVVSVTAPARAEIIARGVPAAKVTLAPNGFDAVPLAAQPAYERRPGETVVTYVGNMGLATGLDVVLDAARVLAAERCRFILIGGGADAERLRARIAQEGLHNVTMLGVLPRADAMKTLECADICVVPLKENIKDSLPTKLFDAMALGCPVVLSAEGEARRILEESGGGLAVRPGDAPALADAIRALAKDERLRAECSRRGRAYVHEHYDRAKVMAALSNKLTAAFAG